MPAVLSVSASSAAGSWRGPLREVSTVWTACLRGVIAFDMLKTILGRIALAAVGLGVVCLVIGSLDPHGGHPPSAFSLLALFLLLPLGVALGVLYVVVAAFSAARTPLSRAAAGSLGAGLGLMAYAAFASWVRRDASPALVMISFSLVALAIALRVADRVRQRG
jgi:hypothetical protein